MMLGPFVCHWSCSCWLQAWINQDNGGPKKYGLTTGTQPNNHTSQEDSSGDDGGGCFMPGTLVRLADGTSIPIEQVPLKTMCSGLSVALCIMRHGLPDVPWKLSMA